VQTNLKRKTAVDTAVFNEVWYWFCFYFAATGFIGTINLSFGSRTKSEYLLA